MKTCAFLGSSGMVSKTLIEATINHGYAVKLFGSSDSAESKFDILKENSWPQKLSYDLVVLNSWIMKPRNRKISRMNMEFGKYVVGLCKKEKNKLVFVSSLSAHSESISNYGASKFAVEVESLNEGFQVLKPGLVVNSHSENFLVGSAGSALRKIPRALRGLSVEMELLVPVIEIDRLSGLFIELLNSPTLSIRNAFERTMNAFSLLRNVERPNSVQVNLGNSALLGLQKTAKIANKLNLGSCNFSDRFLSLVDADTILKTLT